MYTMEPINMGHSAWLTGVMRGANAGLVQFPD
jgi:hypothetical protein